MAIIALVCAVLPCGVTWIAAIVLGIVVLVKTKNGTASGRGLAIGAVLISALWMVAATIGIVVLVNEATKYDDARAANEGTIRSGMLRTGDCLSVLPVGEVIDTVEIIGCEKEHRAEVFAVFSISLASDATQEDIYQVAEQGCSAQFADFVGVTVQETSLRFSLIAPSADGIHVGRDVSCYLYPRSGTVTGTLENSRR